MSGIGSYCLNGVCEIPDGKTLLQSISLKTEACDDCEGEAAVVVRLRGKNSGADPEGVPCNTSLLTTNFQAGLVTTFNGKIGEQVDNVEREKLGNCYKAPLNAEVNGGEVEWLGGGDWGLASLCVDWYGSDYAWVCEASPEDRNVWSLVNCTEQEQEQIVECEDYFNKNQ